MMGHYLGGDVPRGYDPQQLHRIGCAFEPDTRLMSDGGRQERVDPLDWTVNPAGYLSSFRGRDTRIKTSRIFDSPSVACLEHTRRLQGAVLYCDFETPPKYARVRFSALKNCT